MEGRKKWCVLDGSLFGFTVAVSGCGIPAQNQRYVDQRLQVLDDEHRIGIGVDPSGLDMSRTYWSYGLTENVSLGSPGFVAYSVAGEDWSTQFAGGLGFSGAQERTVVSDDPRESVRVTHPRWRTSLLFRGKWDYRPEHSLTVGLANERTGTRDTAFLTLGNTWAFGTFEFSPGLALVANLGSNEAESELHRRREWLVGSTTNLNPPTFVWHFSPHTRVGADVGYNALYDQGWGSSYRVGVSLHFVIGDRYEGDDR